MIDLLKPFKFVTRKIVALANNYGATGVFFAGICCLVAFAIVGGEGSALGRALGGPTSWFEALLSVVAIALLAVIFSFLFMSILLIGEYGWLTKQFYRQFTTETFPVRRFLERWSNSSAEFKK